MKAYPIYRKFSGQNLWAKITAQKEMIIVYLGGPEPDGDKVRINISTNPRQISDMQHYNYSESSTRDDFEKAYGEALFNLGKINCVQ